jgi:hypothetical protein
MASDGLDLELSTMQNIATALAGLDAPARSRVLVWLHLRFGSDAAVAAPTEAEAAAGASVAPLQMVAIPAAIADYDDSLSVDSLAEFFDCAGVKPSIDPPPPLPAAGRFSGIVAEFQDLARDWDNACDTLAKEVQAPRALPAV